MRILSGILSLIPLVYLPLFIIGVFDSSEFGADFGWNVHMGMIYFNILFTIALAIHLFTKTVYNTQVKLLWLLALMFGNIIAFPIYWYLNIWKSSSAQL